MWGSVEMFLFKSLFSCNTLLNLSFFLSENSKTFKQILRHFSRTLVFFFSNKPQPFILSFFSFLLVNLFPWEGFQRVLTSILFVGIWQCFQQIFKKNVFFSSPLNNPVFFSFFLSFFPNWKVLSTTPLNKENTRLTQ